jgi:hypothetical protein
VSSLEYVEYDTERNRAEWEAEGQEGAELMLVKLEHEQDAELKRGKTGSPFEKPTMVVYMLICRHHCRAIWR